MMAGLVISKLIFHLVGKSNNRSNLSIHPVCIQHAAMLFNAFKYLLIHAGLQVYIEFSFIIVKHAYLYLQQNSMPYTAVYRVPDHTAFCMKL